jgi:hypothetical protein
VFVPIVFNCVKPFLIESVPGLIRNASGGHPTGNGGINDNDDEEEDEEEEEEDLFS